MSPQQTIAHYRIGSKLGEGGMGAVYRATDTKLNRDVAIKVLPAAFAEDADRMARFTREAQVLASLNHPNIATIYGVEQGAIVMELVEGKDLAGPLPIDTVIAYARQIAAGLEAAHEKGIVHRDLKPANIKVTPDGVVKLLDFGLAKPPSQAEDAATLTISMTQAGMIVGTAAYMSPEQARGKPVDRRADIWAFGVILYELLTGAPLFGGETMTDVLAAVVRQDVDLTRVPAKVRRLLRACLERDPKRRLQSIGDWELLLDDASAAPEPTLPARASRWPWLAFGLAMLVAVAGWTVAMLRPKTEESGTIRFPLVMPDETMTWGGPNGANVVPSPDGRQLVFLAATPDGRPSLWLRPVNSLNAHRLDQTEGAALPFWSPDSQSIAFFADEKLKKMPAAGGAPITLCEVPRAGLGTIDGGAWSSAGVIVFGGGVGKPLMRIPASGGAASPATTLDVAAGEERHSAPQFLPDGRHLLYFAYTPDPEKRAIYVQELGASTKVLVMKNRYRGAWSPLGYLLFPRENGSLFAQAMDAKTFQLSGEPALVAERVNTGTLGNAAFAVGGGVLVYRGDSATRPGPLVWHDRSGKVLEEVGKPDVFTSLSISPDGKTVAATIGPPGRSDAWVMDLTSGVTTRMTDDGGTATLPVAWSPDSKHLAINHNRGILEVSVASGKIRLLAERSLGLMAHDWASDNRFILCIKAGGGELAALPLEPGTQPRTVNAESTSRNSFRLSPNGKFVAYASTVRNPAQIFVASFPSFEENRQISKDGGVYLTWRKDGKEIFFRAPDGYLMSAAIRTEGKIEAGAPIPLFKYAAGQQGQTYWPSGDGKRFLVKETDRAQAMPITVVVNWAAEIKR